MNDLGGEQPNCSPPIPDSDGSVSANFMTR